MIPHALKRSARGIGGRMDPPAAVNDGSGSSTGPPWRAGGEVRREDVMTIALGLFWLVAGLLLTCAPDPMWDLQHFSNSLDGRVSRRGEAWELRRKVLAFISFPLAALLFYIGFTS
jgi:hypothetical protein